MTDAGRASHSSATVAVWNRVARFGPLNRLMREPGDAMRVAAFELLSPATLVLPRGWALALADQIGRAMAGSRYGTATARAFGNTFEVSDEHAKRMAREWLTRPFRDYVFVKRIAAGREAAHRWRIEVRNEPALLKDPKQSVIVATGHFSRQAMAIVYLPNAIPKPLAAIVAPLEQRPLGPRALRIKLQFGEMMRAMRALRDNNVEVMEVGKGRLLARIVHYLRTPGNAAIISPDVPWHRKSGFEHPFAGYSSQHFALGAARLARLSQCPILTCVPYLEADGRVVLEWHDPIPAPARKDVDADERLTGLILGRLENEIGRRPGQYVLALGQGRKWDAVKQRWIGAGEALSSPSAANVNTAAAANINTTNADGGVTAPSWWSRRFTRFRRHDG